MMTKEDRKIFKEFTDRVHERFSDARVWAFGSRARGTATWESDFDMFIVLCDVDQTIDRWINNVKLNHTKIFSIKQAIDPQQDRISLQFLLSK